MKNKPLLLNLLVFLIIGIGSIADIAYFKPHLSIGDSESEVSHHTSEDFTRGPHRGRLLQGDGFQVEVTIFEPEEIPPKFRIYFYDNQIPISPSQVEYQMELKRLNRTEKIPFQQYENYLESIVDASEPHSFKVKVIAAFKDKTYQWEYESYEGRVEISPEAIAANSIVIETAQPALLKITLNVMGKIILNEEETVHISPRFPGVVKEVFKKLGEYVKKGEALAVIESNESLRNYEIKSDIDGMVIKKNINLGMYISGQESVFVITDLNTVWADFNIYRHDLSQIKVGDSILVKSLDGNISQESTISYISSIGYESTQSIVARAIMENPNNTWKPGLFITGEINVDNAFVDVAIKDSALQTFRDWDVVFLNSGDLFEAAPVKIGKRNKEWVEITSGLSDGDRYVSENSYILKADLEKSGATHDH